MFGVAVGTDGFACIVNRPMEISTKVRPPKLREVIQVPKKVSCAPNLVRFIILLSLLLPIQFDL